MALVAARMLVAATKKVAGGGAQEVDRLAAIPDVGQRVVIVVQSGFTRSAHDNVSLSSFKQQFTQIWHSYLQPFDCYNANMQTVLTSRHEMPRNERWSAKRSLGIRECTEAGTNLVDSEGGTIRGASTVMILGSSYTSKLSVQSTDT